MTGVFLRRAMVALVVCPWALAFPALVHADEVLDWNDVLLHALVSFAPPGAPQFRLAAIVQASVFDAVNGIDRRFTPDSRSCQCATRAPRAERPPCRRPTPRWSPSSRHRAPRSIRISQRRSPGLRRMPPTRPANQSRAGATGASKWPTKSWPGAARTGSIHRHPRTRGACWSANGGRRLQLSPTVWRRRWPTRFPG